MPSREYVQAHERDLETRTPVGPERIYKVRIA